MTESSLMKKLFQTTQNMFQEDFKMGHSIENPYPTHKRNVLRKSQTSVECLERGREYFNILHFE